MANLIRRENKNVTPSRGEHGLDPFRVMDALLRWDPMRDLGSSWGGQGASFVPHFDVKETKEGYLLRADLPGVKESDLDISVTGNVLTISGKREQEQREEGETYYASERVYGEFSRSFSLPDGADLGSVAADLKDGVLSIHLSKKPEVQPKKIAIGMGSSAKA
jgi:HSP20 family protein